MKWNNECQQSFLHGKLAIAHLYFEILGLVLYVNHSEVARLSIIIVIED
jgi:hypothetical protein